MRKTIYTCPKCEDSFEDPVEFEIHLNQHALEADIDWDLEKYAQTIDIEESPVSLSKKEITLKTQSKMDRDAVGNALQEISDEQMKARTAEKKEEILRNKFKSGIITDVDSHKAEADIAEKYLESFILTHQNIVYGNGYKPLKETTYNKILHSLSEETRLLLPKSTEDFKTFDALQWVSYTMEVEYKPQPTTPFSAEPPMHEHVEVKDEGNKEQCSASEQLSKIEQLTLSSKTLSEFEKKLLLEFVKKEKESLSKKKSKSSWRHVIRLSRSSLGQLFCNHQMTNKGMMEQELPSQVRVNRDHLSFCLF